MVKKALGIFDIIHSDVVITDKLSGNQLTVWHRGSSSLGQFSIVFRQGGNVCALICGFCLAAAGNFWSRWAG